MERLLEGMSSELDDVERNPYMNREDKERNRNRVMNAILNQKHNELMRIMNKVANKFIKWSLAKDKFISEIVNFSSCVIAKANTGEITLDHALILLDKELDNLRKQDEALTMKNYRQAIIVKPVTDKKMIGHNGKQIIDVNLIIAGVGFVSGGLQFVAGVGMVSTGISAPFGGLLIAHGVNNIIENGYFLLYREDYIGPLKFLYEEAGSFLGINAKDADVIYSFVDLSLSMNVLFGLRLEEDAARLYRYINADLLWGMKEMGLKLMTRNEMYLEFIGDANTIINI